MNRYKILFLIFVILEVTIHTLRAAPAVDLVRDEDLIPFYTQVTQRVEAESGVLEPGEQVVVVRPVSATSVLVNASRKGTFTLPLDATDLSAALNRMKQEDDPNLKLVPRMSFFLANRVVSGESDWLEPVRDTLVYSATRWILLYGDASAETTGAALRAADDFYEKLSESEREKTVFVYMDVAGDKVAMQDLAAKFKPSIQCMPGYLSRGYTQSFEHVDESAQLPQLVELASSGRLLHHARELDEVIAWLGQP